MLRQRLSILLPQPGLRAITEKACPERNEVESKDIPSVLSAHGGALGPYYFVIN
jgi:hypothetical protein